MLADEFRRRLAGIVDDPQPMFPQTDSSTEEPYLALCDLFLDADDAQRDEIRRRWPFNRMWRVPNPGMTTDRPGGELSQRRLMGSLVGLALENKVADWRDIVLGLPVDYWVAEQLGLDAPSLFRRIANLAVPEVKDIVLGFINRPSPLRTPEYMGWRSVDTPDGRRWKPPG